MQLNKLLPLVIIALVFAGCKTGGNKFHVLGNITNMPVQTAYLYEIGIENVTAIDSTETKADGSFELSGTAPEASIYRISFSTNPNKNIAFSTDSVNNNNITIAGDWDRIETCKITGSVASESLAKFLTVIRESMRDFKTMYVVMDTLKAQGKDSMLQVAQNDFQEMNFQLTRYIEQYADTTKSLPNAVFAVRFLNGPAEKEYLKVFMQNINARFPNAKLTKDYTAKFSPILKGETQQQPAQQPSAPGIGAQAPEISLTTPDGKQVTLSSFKGKYVLVDFWASWCAPCRHENPNVVAAYNKYKNKNFTVLGVSLDDDKDKWMQAIAKDGLSWTHISDLKGWESIAARTYGIQSIPSNFLVDPQGKIIAQDLREGDLDKTLSDVLK
ncbi:MAG: AhpC/TSA family protein [Bacteroidetes bacterium]|nr:AhpC/TSA family protein [Bacteroidota bacterium]